MGTLPVYEVTNRLAQNVSINSSDSFSPSHGHPNYGVSGAASGWVEFFYDSTKVMKFHRYYPHFPFRYAISHPGQMMANQASIPQSHSYSQGDCYGRTLLQSLRKIRSERFRRLKLPNAGHGGVSSSSSNSSSGGGIIPTSPVSPHLGFQHHNTVPHQNAVIQPHTPASGAMQPSG